MACLCFSGAYVASASFVCHSLIVLVIAFTESFGYACVAKKRRRYPRIHFGHLFSGGKTLAYYANTARQETGNSSTYGEGAYDNDSPRAWESGEGGNTYTNSLTYYTWDNNQTTFASQGTKSIAYAMNDQDWDIVIIQGHDIEQAFGDKSNANFTTNLEYLTNYIKSFDSTVEIGWYMTWRRNGGEGFARLQAYWETMQQTVATNENVSFIVPIGTAVENARGTYINQFEYKIRHPATSIPQPPRRVF